MPATTTTSTTTKDDIGPAVGFLRFTGSKGERALRSGVLKLGAVNHGVGNSLRRDKEMGVPFQRCDQSVYKPAGKDVVVVCVALRSQTDRHMQRPVFVKG